VKILAVSDNIVPQMQDVGYLRRSFSDIDLVVSCGDMSPSYLDFIVSALNVPLFFVRGNHDENYAPGMPGGDNLHRCIRRRGELIFVGLEGSINYNFGSIQYTEFSMFKMILPLLPRLLLMRLVRGYGVDVLVTHSPPKGIHDADDRAHRGFRSFRYLMRWTRPRYLIHGHVDTWDSRKPSQTVYGKTTVININPYKLLTIDRG
jgi:Icc-related predicted phosphoesterase